MDLYVFLKTKQKRNNMQPNLINNMTLDEIKLAVCEKLPELLEEAYTKGIFMWKRTWTPVNWPTEGLQVCHDWICSQPSKADRRKINEMLAAKAESLNKTQAELTWEETITTCACFLQQFGGK